MKRDHLVLALFVVTFSGASVLAAPFANLNFEDAVIPGDPLPSWSVNNLGPIYNLACVGSSCVSVHDSGSILADPDIPLEGAYSVFLQGGTSGDSGALPLIEASITQSGDVPANAKSIRLLSTVDQNPDPITSYQNIQVSLDGSLVPLVLLNQTGDVVTLGGNIGSFAGATAELEIATITPQQNGPELWAWVDAVSFSDVAVPEPASSTAALLACFLLVVGSLRKRRP